MTTTKRQTTILVLWALIWALALIGSAFVFKGNPIKTGFNWFCSLSELLSGFGSGNLDDKLAFVAD